MLKIILILQSLYESYNSHSVELSWTLGSDFRWDLVRTSAGGSFQKKISRQNNLFSYIHSRNINHDKSIFITVVWNKVRLNRLEELQ
jgi:hypothetical protein